jgi:FHA domain-containing protein
LLALELIDSGLLLARQRGESGEVLTEVPGIAFLGDDTTRTGDAAVDRIRLNPLLAHTNFWRGLSTEELTRPSRLARTTADIAFAQAEQLLGPHKADGESVLLAVPAGYSREQLPLLLGVINETGVRVSGLVDAALAACSLEPAPARVLHLDLELHQAILTVLEYSGGDRSGLKRSRYEIVLRQGVLDLNQTLRQFIAETFIRKTRFDPLHDASTEQRLVGQVPALLAQLREQEQTVVSMQFGDRPLEVEIERAQVIAALEPHYVELLRLVQGARVAGMQIQLRLAPRIAAYPGLVERFGTLRDCEVRLLPRGAAALGTLQHAATVSRPDSLALVYHLPIARAAGGESIAEPEATPTPLRPTHLLFQGRAWRISDQPLVIGWSVEAPRRALVLPSSSPGVSRSHCTVVRRNGAVMIEDHSTYGSYVNEERVAGRTALTVGDRLRLGSPGVTLELIQLVNDDGAPQD